MKILFVSAILPFPLHSGGQVRIYNLLKKLTHKHEVTLFTFLRNDSERTYLSELTFCKKIETVYRGHAWQPRYIAQSLLSTYPLLFATYAHESLKERIAEELRSSRYDLVHIEPGYVWPSLPSLSVPLVVTEHNIEHLGYKGYVERFSIVPLRPFLAFDVAKLAWWERRVWNRASAIVTVSSEDKEIISSTVSPDCVHVVPNGVDLAEFRFLPKKVKRDSFILLFVGNFLWLQNRDAVKFLIGDIWPVIKRQYPGAQLRIVGRGASNDIREKIQKSNAVLLDGVEDITDQYASADILIAPIRIGSGSRYKILEAMATGLPVVTTSVGAAGLGVGDRKEVMLAQTPEQFLRAASELTRDQKLRDTIVVAARKLIEKSFSWEIIARKLERVWEETCKK